MISQTVAHYKIIEKLGAGGMGEVFLAEDTKLDRKVALKFLPEQIALEGDVKARFLQEAKAAAAFTHPNVCAVYDVLEHDNRMFIVMEYVDGQTLRDKKDSLSVTQIVEIVAQVADGLAAAHAQGIVHRDIKSENIMMRKDGIAQLTDFGLAKIKGVASRLTKEGSTLGTTGYMSPEQALGQDVDHRSDLFSLGVVLFELMTGEMPFSGAHEAAIMYEIVNVEAAPPTAINPDLDPELDRIILECLQKEPDERYQSAREIAKDLRRFKRDSGRKRVSRISQSRVAQSRAPVARMGTAPHSVVEPPPEETKQRTRTTWLPWVLVGLLGITSAALALFNHSSDTGVQQVVRFTVEPPAGSAVTLIGGGNVAISPDGTKLAFVALDSANDQRLWVRSIDAFEARPLTGTDNAMYPFWSPDSRFLGYFSDGKLKKIDVTGGPPLSLCDAPNGRGGSWNANGRIVFAPDQIGWLFEVSAAGGPSTQRTSADTTRIEVTHRWPTFLPDGNRFVYYSRSGGADTDDALVLSTLDGTVNKLLMYHDGNVSFANDHLLFVREGVLMAQPYDDKNDTLTGTPFPLAEGAHFNSRFNNAEFSVSDNGALAFLSGQARTGSVILHYQHSSGALDSIGNREMYGSCRLSPDGSHLAVDINDETSANADIWIIDLVRGITSRLTFDSSFDFVPVWSPDGEYIAYTAFSAGRFRVLTKPVSGVGEPNLLIDTTIMVRPSDWSQDGQFLLCRIKKGTSAEDMPLVLPVDPTSGRIRDSAFTLGDSPGDADVGVFSPDGKWYVYASTETGQIEIYVRSFPGPGGKWQISKNGGDLPRWSGDGSTIYYLNPTYDEIKSAQVSGSSSGFSVGEISSLFDQPIFNSMSPYDVSGNGQDFYFISDDQRAGEGRFNVILNWNAEIPSQ